jgi:hypothetical protein
VNLSTRLAIPIALGGGAVTFVIAFFLFRNANWSVLPALLISLVLFVLATVGIWYLTDSRSSRQVDLDAYALQAEQKVQAVLRQVQQIRLLAKEIQNHQITALIQDMCNDVEELLRRIRQHNPSTLLSSATTLDGYIVRMVPLVEKYIDIANYKRYYEYPDQKLQEIQGGFSSFDTYLVNSIKLITQGQSLVLDVDLQMLEAAQYRRLT